MNLEVNNNPENLKLDVPQIVEAVDYIKESQKYHQSYLDSETLANTGAVLGKAIWGFQINNHDIAINILQFPSSTTYEISGYGSPFGSGIIDGYWVIRVSPLNKELLEADGYTGSDAIALDNEFIQRLTGELARQAQED